MPGKLIEFDPSFMVPSWVPGRDGSIAEGPYGKITHAAWTDAEGKYVSDQLIRSERGGTVCLLIDNAGRYGLIAAWRPVAKDIEEYRAGWPEVSLSDLGRVSVEAVRGFYEPGDSDAVDTAVREAAEEVGLKKESIAKTVPLAYVVDNTSVSSHFTGVVAFMVGDDGFDQVTPHISENIIKGIIWYTPAEVDGMIRSGEIFCSYTLSAIFLYRLHSRS